MAFTFLLAWIVYLLATSAAFLFWIAVGLMVLIGLMQTGFVGLLVKREISLSKEEIKIIDKVLNDSKQSGHSDGQT